MPHPVLPVGLHTPPQDADHVGHISAREGVVDRDPQRLYLAVTEELSAELQEKKSFYISVSR